MLLFFIFFFFQAEDGIRDLTVTGVQTCALPILDKSWGWTAEGIIYVGRPPEALANVKVGDVIDDWTCSSAISRCPARTAVGSLVVVWHASTPPIGFCRSMRPP